MIADLNMPIPLNRSVAGWENVPIDESNEEMVLLNDFAPEYITTTAQYHLQGIPGAIKDCYCRKGVAELLVKAAQNLPDGYKFLIWDAWRPIGVQTYLFEDYKGKLSNDSKLKGMDLQELAQKYVSLPSTDKKRPSPHLTGGAIDLTIVDGDGTLLNMGTSFDHFGAEAQTDFYEVRKSVSDQENGIKQNRRILYNSLVSAGFTNYPDEWWHFDYGNQFWAVLSNKNAFYNITAIK